LLRSRNSSDRRSTVAGFTLIEVLVALAIAGLGLGALLVAVNQGLGSVGSAQQYMEATRRAQSRLATFGTAMAVGEGDWSGDDGGGYSWRVQAHILPGADQKAPLVPYAVDVTVAWQSNGQTRTVLLHSQRLGPHA
jgi:general secretion pathway protein I